MALTQVKALGLAADSIDETKLADDSIDSEHYNDGSIDTAHLADDAVTLAKLASGTDGQIISWDASGNPVAIGPGTDGQVLTSTGAGSPPAFEAASAGATLSGSTNNNVVTVTGANAMIGETNVHVSGHKLLIGHGTSTTDGGDLQVHGVGDARVMDLISNRADVEGPRLRFGKSRAANGGDYTLVEDDDYLGKIEFAGADGTDYNALGAIIQVRVDGTPGSNDMPGRMEFHTTADGNPNPIERMTIDSTGNVTVKDGNLVIGTAGHGIDFSATANNGTSTPQELFDDYEEGTWTPSDGGGIVSYAEAYGQYTKIGRAVYLWFKITCTSSVTDSGNAYIVGLPFTSENAEATGHGGLAIGGSNSTDNFMSASTNKNSTVLYLYKNTYGDNMTRAQMWDGASTTKRLTGCFMYCTSS